MAINFGAVPYAVNQGRNSDHFVMDKVGDVVEHHLKKKQWENRLALATQVQIYKEEERHDRQKKMVDYRNRSRYTWNRREARARRGERRNEAKDAADARVDAHARMATIDIGKHQSMGNFDAQNAAPLARNKAIGAAQGKVAGDQILLQGRQSQQPLKHQVDAADNQADISNFLDRVHAGMSRMQPGGQIPHWYTPPQGTPWNPQTGQRTSNVRQSPPQQQSSTPPPQPGPQPQSGPKPGRGGRRKNPTPQPASTGAPNTGAAGNTSGGAPFVGHPNGTVTPPGNPHASGNGTSNPPQPAPPGGQVNQGRNNPHASGNGTAAPKQKSTNPRATKYVPTPPTRRTATPAGTNIRSGTQLNLITKVNANDGQGPRSPREFEHTRASLNIGEIPHEHEDGPLAMKVYQQQNPGWRPLSTGEMQGARRMREARKAGTYTEAFGDRVFNEEMAKEAQARNFLNPRLPKKKK